MLGYRLFEASYLNNLFVLDQQNLSNKTIEQFLDRALKQMRNCETLPMGGVQVICCGDFLQLPPIRVAGGKNYMLAYMAASTNSSRSIDHRYCFQSPVWTKLYSNHNSFVLERVYRQAGDDEFISVLEDIRQGLVSERVTALLKECTGRQLAGKNGVLPTIIFTHKYDDVNITMIVHFPNLFVIEMTSTK
jgi:ATP-dependent DNA helicase PIF1